MNKKEQNIQGRRAFEALVAKTNPTMDLHWDDSKQKFSNLFTQQQWKGFMLCYEAGNHSENKTENQQKSGFCIIGRYGEKGIIISPEPVTHRSFRKAFTEAKRLSENNPEHRFVIFQSVVSLNGSNKNASKATADENEIIE